MLVKDTNIFIGGPWDHRQVEVKQDLNYLEVPVYTSINVRDTKIFPQPKFKTAHYVKERFIVENTALTCWRYTEIPVEKAVLMLFEYYGDTKNV